MHIASIGLEIDDRISDQLAGTMVRDVAAAAGLVNLDAARGKEIGRRQDVRPAAVAADAEREDVRMLEENQQIADAPRLPLLDERSLERKRVEVGDASEPANVKAAQGPSSPAAVSSAT
jgi:hypothetical protein